MFGPVLKAMSKKYPDQKDVVFFQGQGQYQGAAHYYKLAYTKQGYHITEVNQETLETLKPGQVVIVASSDLTGYLEDRFQTEVLYAYHASRVYRILEKK